MRRPLIGITTYVTPARWSYWDVEAALVPSAYVDALERAGARPMLVPPSDDGVRETLDALDACCCQAARTWIRGSTSRSRMTRRSASNPCATAPSWRC